MKCPNCGSSLTIDDAVCSFCGTENPYAKKHRQEMRQFTKAFNETKTEVLEKSQKINFFAVKIAIIAVLVALSLVFVFLGENSYQIERMIQRNKIESNYSYYKAKMDELEANRDYAGMAAFYEYQRIHSSERFEEFRAVYRISDDFRYYSKYVMEIYQYDGSQYYEVEDRFRYVAEQLENIYKYQTPPEYANEAEYSGEHLAYMNDCIKETEEIAQVFFNLTQEEVESLPTLSIARKQILLEEGYARNETSE